jgi:aspartate racemase
MDTIYGEQGIKAGYKIIQKRTMIRIVEDLIEKKAQAIIMGCTEIPLILKDNDVTIPLIDPLEIIAKKSIIKANVENI